MVEILALLQNKGFLAPEKIHTLIDLITDDPGCLKPPNFSQFVNQGTYRHISMPESHTDGDKVLFVTGCGRSGTTITV